MINYERQFLQSWDEVFYPRGPEMPEEPEAVQVAQAPVEGEGGAAFGVFPTARSRSRAPTSEAAKMMVPDVAAGAVKGTVTGAVGLPGDIESLIRGVRGIFQRGGDQGKLDAFLAGMEEKTILPTSEDVSKWLDANVGPVVPPGAPMAKERAGVAAVGQFAGEITSSPAALVKGAKAGGRAAKETAKFVAPKVGEMLDDYMRRAGLTPELMAFHGTPARFAPEEGAPMGRFRAEKIGSGEGAQAFGYGLYFAEAPGVAKGYALQLSTPSGPVGDVAKYWRDNGGEQAYRAYAKDAGLETKEIEEVVSAIRSKGNVYTVDIPNEMVSKMLDWDRPLSQQSKAVRDAIKKANPGLFQSGRYSDRLSSASAIQSRYPGRVISDLFEQANASVPATRYGKPADDMYGIDYWALALRVSENDPAKASQFLREAGILGIRYLDQSSRGAGDGTRNIVVFPGEEDKVKILKVE